jgi:hypothetical protein
VLFTGLPLSAIGLCIVAMALGGCGGEATAQKGASKHARAAHSIPAYRAGQYCITSKKAKYLAMGFVCDKHHLARR